MPVDAVHYVDRPIFALPSVEALVRQLGAGRLEELVRSGELASHAVKPIAALI
ncbi:hypothetical protein [Mycobacterium sp.]|uniref:hypothetical protein n=1 Tax=Mycobacterium sp. TaxID=1785 RepID=UPI002637E1E4|nr:hypothetical protein [Mycobacterium sp.]